MYKTIKSYDVPVSGKYNTINLSLYYDTECKHYVFSGHVENVRRTECGLICHEYEPFSKNTSRRYIVREVSRRTAKQDKIAESIAETLVPELINYFCLYSGVVLAVKDVEV